MANTPFKLPKLLTPGFSTSEKPTIPVVLDLDNPLTDNLIAAYIFDGNGIASDLVSDSYGDITGAAFKGGNLVFDGNDHISVRNYSKFAMQNISITVFAKKVTDVVNARVISSPATGDGFDQQKKHILCCNSGKWGITNRTSLNANGKNTATNNWEMVTGCTNGTGAIYVDGQGPYNDDIGANGLGYTDGDYRIGERANGLYDFKGELRLVYWHKGTLTETEIKSLHKNPYQILKPATSQYAILGSDAGGITGTATPAATTASSSASGTVTANITGTAATTANTATVNGSGLRLVSGSSTTSQNNATTSASGTVSGNITGSSSASADNATASGTGLRLIAGTATVSQNNATTTGNGSVGGNISGSASPQAQQATANATGLRLITGNSASQAETATTTASGVVGNAVIGSGTPQAETATSTGSGLRLIQGSATTQAETATSTGTGGNAGVITGTSSAQAETAGVTATGVVLTTITGTASVQASTATASGTDADSTTIHPRRIYTVETENRVYTVEAEDRVYVA